MKITVKSILFFGIIYFFSGCGLFGNREVKCPFLDVRKDKSPDTSFRDDFYGTFSIVGISYNGVENSDSTKAFSKVTINFEIKMPKASFSLSTENQGYCYQIEGKDTTIKMYLGSIYVKNNSANIDFIVLRNDRFVSDLNVKSFYFFKSKIINKSTISFSLEKYFSGFSAPLPNDSMRAKSIFNYSQIIPKNLELNEWYLSKVYNNQISRDLYILSTVDEKISFTLDKIDPHNRFLK